MPLLAKETKYSKNKSVIFSVAQHQRHPRSITFTHHKSILNNF